MGCGLGDRAPAATAEHRIVGDGTGVPNSLVAPVGRGREHRIIESARSIRIANERFKRTRGVAHRIPSPDVGSMRSFSETLVFARKGIVFIWHLLRSTKAEPPSVAVSGSGNTKI